MSTRAQEQAALAARVEELAVLVENQGVTLQEQKATIESQSRTIMELRSGQAETAVPDGSSSTRTNSSAIKAPSIPYFSGDGDSRTSTKVKSFVYNVRKAGTFSNLTEDKMVALAECHLTDAAASWMMRIEEEGRKPSSLSGLLDIMIREFVPPDEKARAQIELMELKMKGSMDSHIAKFKKLAEITSTPLKEAYMLFFMSMPAKYKQEFHKKYPTGSPPANVDMSDVYEHARTLAVAMQWTTEENKPAQTGGKEKTGKSEGSNGVRTTTRRTKGQSGVKKTRKQKDDSLESWGPKQPGEAYMYIRADRFMDCGKKGWKNKYHPCRQKKSQEEPKNE